MKKKINAFSLVELLIVLAIAGALAAIAFPLFNDYRNNSNDATAQADTKNSIQIIRTSIK